MRLPPFVGYIVRLHEAVWGHFQHLQVSHTPQIAMAGLMGPALDLLCIFTRDSNVGRVCYPLSADTCCTMGVGAERELAAKLQPHRPLPTESESP